MITQEGNLSCYPSRWWFSFNAWISFNGYRWILFREGGKYLCRNMWCTSKRRREIFILNINWQNKRRRFHRIQYQFEVGWYGMCCRIGLNLILNLQCIAVGGLAIKTPKPKTYIVITRTAICEIYDSPPPQEQISLKICSNNKECSAKWTLALDISVLVRGYCLFVN